MLAMLVDRWIGEPPNALHPVVWMGTCIRWLAQTQWLTRRAAAFQWLWGAAVTLLVPLSFACGAWLLLRALSPWPASHLIVSALMLKSTLSLDGLRKAGQSMSRALSADIDSARYALRHLCSRDPSELSQPQLIAATVESLAENTSDSVIAPLFYYALFGVPGAVAYRAVNTLDAMIGYHGRYEYLGKVAARTDDVLNLIPARLTACLLLLAGAWRRHDVQRGLRTLLRDRARTESPNAGWPMSVMAGLLGVRLEKPAHYVLGDDVGAPLSAQTIDQTWRIVRDASWAGMLLLSLSLGVAHVIQ